MASDAARKDARERSLGGAALRLLALLALAAVVIRTRAVLAAARGVVAEDESRHELQLRASNIDFDVARRLAKAEEVATAYAKCDVTVDIELYGALPISLNFRALEAEWSRDKGDLRKEIKVKFDAPQKAIGAAVLLARKVKESLELRIEDDGVLSGQWHSFEATAALPGGAAKMSNSSPHGRIETRVALHANKSIYGDSV